MATTDSAPAERAEALADVQRRVMGETFSPSGDFERRIRALEQWAQSQDAERLRQHTGAEAVLARVRALPKRWRKESSDVRIGRCPCCRSCADELDAALSAQAQPTASREPEA